MERSSGREEGERMRLLDKAYPVLPKLYTITHCDHYVRLNMRPVAYFYYTDVETSMHRVTRKRTLVDKIEYAGPNRSWHEMFFDNVLV